MSSIEIADLEARLQTLEEALVGGASEDFQQIEPVHDDLLTAIELGVNIVIENLRTQIENARQVNHRLDELVNERTQELERKLVQITTQHEVIRRQQDAIRELSTPVLRLWDNVIALPLIGVIDTHRSTAIMDQLLHAIAAGHARYAILDVTGVEVLDTSTASHLLQIVQAAELLGARCVLTGVQPTVAQTLVGIGVELGTLMIRRNLQDGLKACLKAMSRDEDEAGTDS